MNLENTKVYTTDPEVIRKYAELCGKPFFDQGIKTKGWFNGEHQPRIYNFVERCDIDYDNDIFATINPDQINALYDEKFGVMAQDNEQLQNYEMSDLHPVIDVDGKLYTADDVRALLSHLEAPNSSEWKNGDECIYCGDVWNFVSILSDEFHGTAVIFDRISEELKQVDLSKIKRPETPQQREERERNEWAQNVICEMMDATGLDFTQDGDVQVVKAMYDLGYQKQKDGD